MIIELEKALKLIRNKKVLGITTRDFPERSYCSTAILTVKKEQTLSSLIRKLEENAYYRWLNAGQPEGKEIEFWREAEQEVLGQEICEVVMNNDSHQLRVEYWKIENEL